MAYPPANLTWTATAERAITVAGANATIAELLTAIKFSIDTDSTLWMTSDYNAGNGTLELKRKASPSGEQATVRILLFGGQIPNSAAVASGWAFNVNTLYGCMSVDAATAGPPVSYATAAPYTTKFVRADRICGNTDIVGANTPKVHLVESPDAIAIVLHCSTNTATFVAGYIIDDIQNSLLHWGLVGSGAAYANPTNDTQITGQGTAWALPIFYPAGGYGGAYWNSLSLTCRKWGRVNAIYCGAGAYPILGASGGPAYLMPIAVADGIMSVGATPNFVGLLRQIRLGPAAMNLQTLRNVGGVQQAICAGVGVGNTGYGVWFDQTY